MASQTKTEEEKYFDCSGQKLINKADAWMKGKKVKISVRNPDKSATNERYVRRKLVDIWGTYGPRKPRNTVPTKAEQDSIDY